MGLISIQDFRYLSERNDIKILVSQKDKRSVHNKLRSKTWLQISS